MIVRNGLGRAAGQHPLADQMIEELVQKRHHFFRERCADLVERARPIQAVQDARHDREEFLAADEEAALAELDVRAGFDLRVEDARLEHRGGGE